MYILIVLKIVLALVFFWGSTQAFAEDENLAHPSVSCPIPSLVTKHYLSEFPELGSIPIVQDPANVVVPGDVLVQVLGKDQKQEKDAWKVMLGASPHAMIVMRQNGMLGHLNSPSFYAGNFVPEFKMGLSYVILRPKFTPDLKSRYPTEEAFRNEMDRYLNALQNAGFIYDPMMQTDILDPNYTAELRKKIQSNCLKKKDLRPIYCSELAATAGALVEIPVPKGKSLDELFDSAVRFVKANSLPDEVEKRVNAATDEIIDRYLTDFREDVAGTEETIKHLKNNTQLIGISVTGDQKETARLERKLLELKTQIALFEASRNAVKTVALSKAFPERKISIPGPIKQLLKSMVIRPEDYLSEAKAAGYEVIGLYAANIPKECFSPPPTIVESPTH